MRRHDETWQFGFSDKDNKSELEREIIMTKHLDKFIWFVMHALQY